MASVKIPLSCANCSAVFQVLPYLVRRGRKYCSASCQRKGRFAPATSRFWARVEKSDACWLWTGPLINAGYGKFKVESRTRSAHRFSYELRHGPIPEGMIICHTCDNPPCVNPDHLFLGTNKDNSRDMVAKNRAARLRGERANGVKLTTEDVLEIRRLRKAGVACEEVARQFSLTKAHVWRVAQGTSWAHLQHATSPPLEPGS